MEQKLTLLNAIKAVVVHSGGMDSSLCLKIAIDKWGADQVLSLGFRYGQRHEPELKMAQQICHDWNVKRIELELNCLEKITNNALVNHKINIEGSLLGAPPNTLVTGRNGLMAMIAGIHAHELGAKEIYLGVIEVDSANSGYRDCSRQYMDLVQDLIRLDSNDESMMILTPLIQMTKYQTMQLGLNLGVLEYLLDHTISCYEGIKGYGCGKCPACLLRNDGIRSILADYPDLVFSYCSKMY